MLPFSPSIRCFLNRPPIMNCAKAIDSACNSALSIVDTTQKVAELAAGGLFTAGLGFLFQKPIELLLGVGTWTLGFSLIKKSGIIPICSARIFGASDNEIVQKVDAKCIVQAAIGSALIMYGSITTLAIITQLFKMSLVSQFRNCIEANTLWETVEKEGTFSIRYFGDLDGLKASWNWEERLIRIRPDLGMHEKIAGLLFELGNASQSQKIVEICQLAQAGGLGVAEFVRKMLQVEFNSKLISHDIAKKCTSNKEWSSEVLPYAILSDLDVSSFDTFFHQYLTQERFTQHRHYIIDMWSSSHKNAFCNKNPLSSLCNELTVAEYDKMLL
jgi:hypothetical protein